MSVLAGPDPRDRFSLPAGDVDWAHCTDGGIQGFRVAYSPDWSYAAVDPQVRALVGDAVEVFERELGCRVERVEPGWPHPYESVLGDRCQRPAGPAGDGGTAGRGEHDATRRGVHPNRVDG